MSPGHADQLYVGLTIIQLHSGKKAEYFKIPLPSSARYEGEWFYVRNVARSAPLFTGQEPVSTEEWQCNGEASLKIKVENLLTAVKTLKQRGLSSVWLVHTFMHHRYQLLMAR